MANVKHFADLDGATVELTKVHPMDKREFARRFPGVTGRRSDSFSMWVGLPVGTAPTFVQGEGWNVNDYVPVTREITYGGKGGRAASLHVCDARCMGASGRTMNCECACGGKNHGRGFAAEAV